MTVRLLIVLSLLIVVLPHTAGGDDTLQFGFGKTDITPQVPLRLSGYASRAEPFEGVDEPLNVRAMAMRTGDDGPLAVLVSVDTIGFAGTLTKSIFERIAEQHGLTRERFVICCTHSHTSPEVGALTDMYDVPFNDQQIQNTRNYTDEVANQVVAAVDKAVSDLRPGRMFAGEGEATFAVNRRVINDGTWAGFGVNPEGPVDHRLPFLKITTDDGKSIRGILFNYACHCTTFGGEYNRVNGDWAGYSAKYLEAAHGGALALCTIGTGADANPQRDREKAFMLAQEQGQQIADSINSLLDGQLTEVTARPTASFGYAGLPIDRPTKVELKENLKNSRRPVRLHAENMLATWDRMGRLPETYPMPIQVWRFGDQFAMVFLGGEVCVDYGLRIKQELGPNDDARDVQPESRGTKITPWVAAYANDVFGYVASERMRPEGGYEVDFSMIYYMLPGRWSTGTEEVILRRVHEMYENTGKVGPLSPDDAKATFTFATGYALEIVAAEPMVRDPVNMALDEDGSLWVVEMGDYPRGKAGEERHPGEGHAAQWEGPPGGAIKHLTDTDGDGRYDKADMFLDGLSFPTGVIPWNGGVLVSGAPDIFFARDTDGDGTADEQEALYSGFEEANPQHRINGFVRDLDGWFQLASGTNNGTITSVKTGERLDMSGRDLRIHPETGKMETLSGRSQYGRTSRMGQWFGNDNSNPLWHYVIEDRYVKRNPFVAAPSPKVALTEPAVAPPVYPTSRTLDRFNDLFALNRFTSACSPYIWKAVSTDDELTALVCEPVHNLVSRIILEPEGVTFRGRRHEDEQQSEFFSSTDNWFRPVKVIEDPQGNLLICDMYRMVIEHPEWIPEAWQAQLDIYAGHNMGRIWRLKPPRGPDGPFETKRALAESGKDTQRSRDRLIVQRFETALEDEPKTGFNLISLAEHDEILVRYQTALSLGDWNNPLAADALLNIAARNPNDVWVRAAVLSSALPHALPMLTSLLKDGTDINQQTALLEGLIATALGKDVETSAPGIARIIAASLPGSDVAPWQLPALASFLDALERRGSSWERVIKADDEQRATLTSAMAPIFAASRARLANPNAAIDQRVAALPLLGHEAAHRAADVAHLKSLLSPQTPVELQEAAIGVLAKRIGNDLPSVLLADWPRHSPAVRATITGTLLSRDNWMAALVESLRSGDVPPTDLDASARQRLLGARQKPIRIAARELFDSAGQTDRAEVVAAHESVLSLTGDVTRGSVIFKKICSACHQHGGMGKDLAPKLATVTNKSTDAMLTAILDPNRAVEQKYAAYVVVTNDGRSLSGLIKSETGNSLTLAEGNGKEHVILRIDIEEMTATGKSFMPEGLEKDLSPQDIADVISFVRTPPAS